LLVTSASRERWIIPKGNIEPHLGPEESARAEALEEGGVTGYVHPAPLGTYVNARPIDPTLITVYSLRVERELPDARWSEHHLRRRAWLSPREAAQRVEEADLRALIIMAAELLE
jgi:8-oxo-dGTP pyrophosphatase MutT (NUDIX family)